MDYTEKTAQEALDSAKSAHKRIDKLEEDVKDIRSLASAMARVDEKVDNLELSVEEIKFDVKEINRKPAKNWEKFISGLIGAITTGLVGAIIALVLR